ncbi:MAG TPA: TetR/AcrR family transcriptional regulator [Solirubrobacterales bacterium]|nr:TetR/AcrR family transcriptional regulator [Solirubrobacterales bacterium]
MPPRGGPGERGRLLDAMLEIVGERGWRAAEPATVAGRAGTDLAGFHRHFAGPDDCFLAAYETAVERRVASMVELAAAASDRGAAIHAALTCLFHFATRRTAQARAVMVEVYVAGGAVLAVHQEVLERLSRAVAGACRETDQSRHDPPPLTAAFIVGGLEESIRRRLAERREALLWEDLPELSAAFLAVLGE